MEKWRLISLFTSRTLHCGYHRIFGAMLRLIGKIGAGTCFSLLHSDPLIRRCVPILAEASRQVGSPQIRNIATIGGNICNGAVSAYSAPSLLVLDARLELASSGGSRTLPIREFLYGPWENGIESGRRDSDRNPDSAREVCGTWRLLL